MKLALATMFAALWMAVAPSVGASANPLLEAARGVAEPAVPDSELQAQVRHKCEEALGSGRTGLFSCSS